MSDDTEWESLFDELGGSSAAMIPRPATISPGLSDDTIFGSLRKLSIGQHVQTHVSTTDNSDSSGVAADTTTMGGGSNPDPNPNTNPNTPRLVYQSSTTLVYRVGSDRGLKIIRNPSASLVAAQQYKLQLQHEHRVLNYLPPSFPKRRISKVEHLEDGRLSICYEWVDGISLEDWLQVQVQVQQQQQQQQQQQLGAQDVLKLNLSVAIAIAKTLADYHEAGVAFNNPSPSNIIVETYANGGRAVHFINLSKSIIMNELPDGESVKKAQRADLQDLGRVFQRLFGVSDGIFDRMGEGNERLLVEEESEDSYDVGRKKRSKTCTEQELNEGLPLYLVAVIAALVNNNNSSSSGSSSAAHANSGEQYKNVKDVLNDLKAASNKFETYFRPFDWKKASLLNHLPVPPSAFYGRQSEMSILMNSLYSVLNSGQPMMTVVGGHSGMGKSYLVNQVKKIIHKKKGYFIDAKFDVAGGRPDSVLFAALGAFFGWFVEKSDDDSKAQMRQRIIDDVGFGIGDLVQAIPNLSKVIGEGHTHNTNENNPMMVVGEGVAALPKHQLLHRSKFLLCKLAGAIAVAQHPLLLVFDDLQWADETSLSVIQTIVSDPDIRYCLHVGCYRDNEVGTQKVVPMITEVKRHLNVFTINLGPLEKETVNTLVSEAMCLPPSLSQPLAAIVHTKTAGSPLFCVSFLSDGMIRFNLNTRRWEYDTKRILMNEIPLSVVQYMKDQMTKLPLSYCLVLKLSSCLGRHFDLVTFLKAKVKSDYDLVKVLPFVCQIGFLHEISPGKFMWAHDQVQQAAYELIPEHMREQFHLLIATRLLMNTTEKELQTDAIFAILRHMNKGIRLIQKDEQKYEVARLNLLAGEACIKNSSFHSAGDYFTIGIKLLPEECWANEYYLALNLYDAAQEALFVTGDFPTLRQLNAEVITKARGFDDKLNSYNNLVRHLVSSEQIEEAISTCTSVLSELGEPMPGPVTNEACYQAIVSTKMMLAEYPGDEILGLQPMTDPRKLAAAEFVQCILLATFNSPDPRMGVLLVSKLIQMTLEHGLSEASTFAFAMYGTMLVHGTMKDLEGGYRYGNLAIKLLNVLGASRFKARVFTMVFGLVNIWRDPFQASLDSLLDGYNAGCITGDVEYAFRSTHIYSELALFTGQDLAMLQEKTRNHAKRALQCKQVGAELSIVFYLSVALQLTEDGSSKEDVYQTLLNTTEDALFQLLESRNDRRSCFIMLNNRKITHIFKGEMESAIEVYKQILNDPMISLNLEHIQTMPYIMGAFADGLIAFFCARKSDEDKQKWSKTGEDIMETFKTWEVISDWNFGNKSLLLEAEYYFLQGKNEMALEKYEASIASAKSHRFVHEMGLANYLFGQYHLAQGRRDDARQSFFEAKKCYITWGAFALVSQMEQLISTLEM